MQVTKTQQLAISIFFITACSEPPILPNNFRHLESLCLTFHILLLLIWIFLVHLHIKETQKPLSDVKGALMKRESRPFP
jgi:hypothetical protein